MSRISNNTCHFLPPAQYLRLRLPILHMRAISPNNLKVEGMDAIWRRQCATLVNTMFNMNCTQTTSVPTNPFTPYGSPLHIDIAYSPNKLTLPPNAQNYFRASILLCIRGWYTNDNAPHLALPILVAEELQYL